MASTAENKAENVDTMCSCKDCQAEGTVHVPVSHQFASGVYCEDCAMHLKGHGSVVDQQPYPNTNNREEQVNGKKYYCKYRCGAQIIFDNNIKSKNDKRIPLNLDRTTHSCPNNPYNQQADDREKSKIYFCNYCGTEITFDNNKKTQGGKSIPLNPDKTDHDCPNYPF